MSNPIGPSSGTSDPEPSGANGLVRILALAVLGLALISYLLGYADGVSLLVTSRAGVLILAGGLLAGASVLPRVRQWLVPAAVIIAAGVLQMLLEISASPVSLGAIAIIAVLLAVLQLMAVVTAVLVDQGLVSVSSDRSSARHGRSGGEAAGQYPRYPGGPYGGQYPGGGYGGYPAAQAPGQPGQGMAQPADFGHSPGGYGGYPPAPGYPQPGYPVPPGYGPGGYPAYGQQGAGFGGYGQPAPGPAGYGGYVPQQGGYGSPPAQSYPGSPQQAEPPAPRSSSSASSPYGDATLPATGVPEPGPAGEPGSAGPSGSSSSSTTPGSSSAGNEAAEPTGAANGGTSGAAGAGKGNDSPTTFIPPRPRPEDESRGGHAS